MYKVKTILLLFLALSIVASASAATYTFYSSQGTIKLPEFEAQASINFGGRADLDSAVRTLESALNQNLSKASMDALRNITLTELNNAKRDDIVHLVTPSRSFLLRYKDCSEADGYNFCFTQVIYPEEDGLPLGSRTYSKVKIVNGSFQMPVTITAEKLESKATVKRTITPASAFPGEQITVKVELTNTGTLILNGVRITERPPFWTDSGETTIFKGGLIPKDKLTLEYKVRTQAPGNLTFSGTIEPAGLVSLPDTVYKVKRPLEIVLQVPQNAILGVEVPFNLTITNSFTEDIRPSKFILSVPNGEISALNGASYSKSREGTFEIRSLDLEPKEKISINGTVKFSKEGASTLQIQTSYNANIALSDLEAKNVQVEPQGIALSATTSKTEVALTLKNTATERINNVIIDWGDGNTETINALNTQSSLTLKHTYVAPATSPANIKVNYELNARTDSRELQVPVPGLPLAPPPRPTQTIDEENTDSNGEENQGGQDNQSENPVDEKPPAPANPTPTPTEPKPGLIKRILNWFEGLFS